MSNVVHALAYSAEERAMPYIKLETNAEVLYDKEERLISGFFSAIKRITGKSEDVTQIVIDDKRKLIMGRSKEPTAHVSLKAINLTKEKAEEASKAICDILADVMGIKGNRVFIAFEDFSGAMWGKDGKTLS